MAKKPYKSSAVHYGKPLVHNPLCSKSEQLPSMYTNDWSKVTCFFCKPYIPWNVKKFSTTTVGGNHTRIFDPRAFDKITVK